VLVPAAEAADSTKYRPSRTYSKLPKCYYQDRRGVYCTDPSRFALPNYGLAASPLRPQREPSGRDHPRGLVQEYLCRKQLSATESQMTFRYSRL
jgi:hypothetical protein